MNRQHHQRTPGDLLLADAAALVRVASPEDWPGGFVVINERLPPSFSACSVGDGEGLAAMFGHRGGRHAVLVDVNRYLLGPANPTLWERAVVEAVVCHEAAHAVTSVAATPKQAAELLEAAGDAVPAYAPERVADMHGPTWAAAYWLLADRGAQFRGQWGDHLRRYVRTDLARYGFPPDDVARVTRGADPGVALRRLLTRGGPAETLLATVLPDTKTRAAAIVANGIARAPQPTGVA